MRDISSLKDLAPLIGGAAGLLGTLITVTVSWLKDRSETARRVARLDGATKRVAFLQTWYDARSRFDPGEAETVRLNLLKELDSIMGEFRALAVGHAVIPAATAAENRRRVGWFRRALLLYKPVRWRAWVPRLFFYLLLLETVVYPIAAFHEPDLGYFFLGVGIFLVLLWLISIAME